MEDISSGFWTHLRLKAIASTIFVERILIPPKKRKVPDIALQELLQFFQFAENLQKLLLSAKGSPLLPAEAWSHYSYWFDKIGNKLNKQLGSALDKFLTWEPVGENPQAKVAIKSYVHSAKLTIHQLTMSPYSHFVAMVLQQHRINPPITKAAVTRQEDIVSKHLVKAAAAKKIAKKKQVKLLVRH
jgi:hypothetical protein